MRESLFRTLFVENAMHAEAERAWRRLWRGGDSNATRIVNRVVMVLVAFFYVWICISVLKYGSEAYEALGLLELFIITLLLPVTVYAAIAGEREKATWEALILTRLTPVQIMVGKLAWRVLFVLIIMGFSFLPILLSVAVTHIDPNKMAPPAPNTDGVEPARLLFANLYVL